jgi:hypothetical protein
MSLTENNESEISQQGKKTQLVTFRIPIDELIAFDATYTGDRAQALRSCCRERVKQFQASGSPTQSDDSAYEEEKKALRNSFVVVEKIIGRINDDNQMDNMKSIAVELCNFPNRERRRFDDIVAKVVAEPNLMRKLYGYIPVWDHTLSSIEPQCWELFLQLIDEYVKQVAIKKKINDLRFRKDKS